jgi:DNA-binding beta-propeller fold protein YncE
VNREKGKTYQYQMFLVEKKESKTRRNFLLNAIILIAVLLFSACISPRPVPNKPYYFTFFPPPPQSPRIQFLTSISDAKEYIPKKRTFADFIIGADKKKERDKSVKKPYGVAIKDGVIFVCDTDRNRIDVLDLKAQKFSYIGGTAAGQLKKPINIAIDDERTIFVTDTVIGGIAVIDKFDRFIGLYGREELERPTGIAIFKNKLFVTDVSHNEIFVFEKNTGKLLDRFGKNEDGTSRFAAPTNITLDKEGNIYVSETMGYRVQKLSQDGKPLMKFGGGLGDAFGQFARPRGVAVDREGRVFSIDGWHNVVQIFDTTGNMLLFFGEIGNEPGNLNLPAQIIIDYDNVELFKKYAAPEFEVEFLIIVTSQYGVRKVNIYGFGHKKGEENI